MECEEIERTFPSSFRLVFHNVSGILATLWLTMRMECEEFVSLNEDPYYERNSCNLFALIDRNLDYVCKENGNCIVDVTRRNQCQSCRFKKCLQVNMKKEGEYL